MVCMVGFFNKDDEGGNYGTAEKEGDTSAGNTRTDEQTSKSNQTQERQTADSIVGIDGLMDKRVKLEESLFSEIYPSCRSYDKDHIIRKSRF